MIAPTSRYGCGDDECIACYGDEEWARATNPEAWAADDES